MTLRPRSVGEILDGAFQVYRQDAGLYLFTAVIAMLPMSFLMILGYTAGDSGAFVLLTLVLFPFAVIGAIAVWAALLHQMNERLDGRRPQLGPSFKRALRLVPRIVWGGIISYLLLGGGILLVALVAGVVAAVAQAALGETALMVTAVLLMLGGMAWVVVVIVSGVVLFLPTLVHEGTRAYASIKRGFALAKGGRLRIVAVLAIAWILMMVLTMSSYVVTGTTQMLIDPEAAGSGTMSAGQIVVQQVLVLLGGGITTPFFVACLLLLYLDQRVRREAYDLEVEATAIGG